MLFNERKTGQVVIEEEIWAIRSESIISLFKNKMAGLIQIKALFK